jgi:hypothetical protein
MYQQDPEQRLWLARRRQAEFIHEAEEGRLARAHAAARAGTQAGGPTRRVATRLWAAIRSAATRARLARSFAGVRRADSGYRTPCNEPCPDRAAG